MKNAAQQIREEARRLGFDFTGIAKATFMEEEARRLETWLRQGWHGKMAYMERYFDMRTDPRRLVEGARSVIMLAYNYYSPDRQKDPEAPRIARYAYGKDYHRVVKDKLYLLLQFIRDQFGDINGRYFVDSGPVMERDWARRSGLGWTGRNTLAIHPRQGSYFFLATLILDLELPADNPINDHCGTCTRCIDACPTEAISPAGYWLDASKCISYLTIELRDEIPESFRGKMEGWAFGCDICQEVCPWNRFSQPHSEPAFDPPTGLMEMKRSEWEEITEELFNTLFGHSAVKRTKYEGLKRNIRFLQQ